MAASIKVSELQSLTTLTGVDLFLVSDMESGTSRRISYTDLHTNLTSELQSALDTLTDTVGQNRLDAETLVEQVRLVLVETIASNKTLSDGTDAQLQADLDTAIANLTAYIDSKVQEVIDLAPESLDTLNELAQALQDNPNIIADLQVSIADEVARATSVESAIQSELTAYKAHIEERNLELALAFDVPTYAEIIYGG